MKPNTRSGYFPLILILLGFFLRPAHADELDGLKIQGTMKEIKGAFGTYGHVKTGDLFEIDLAYLPKKMIKFTRPDFVPNSATAPYIPFSSPLVLEKMKKGEATDGGETLLLSSINAGGKLIIQVSGEHLVKGGKISIHFYEEHFGKSNCTAEAEGVLK